MVSSRPSAGCYKTLCKGEGADRQLYVEFEGSGVQVACPSGALIDLSSIEGAATFPSAIQRAILLDCCVYADVQRQQLATKMLLLYISDCAGPRTLLAVPPS